MHFTILVTMIVICSLKIWLIKKPDNINVNVIPKTNEEYISVSYGCIRFIDSYRFLQSGLDGLIKTLHEDDLIILKKEFPNIEFLIHL